VVSFQNVVFGLLALVLIPDTAEVLYRGFPSAGTGPGGFDFASYQFYRETARSLAMVRYLL
jgi:hypothetical protein